MVIPLQLNCSWLSLKTLPKSWTGGMMGLKVGNEYLTHLQLANVILLFTEISDELQQMIEELNY